MLQKKRFFQSWRSLLGATYQEWSEDRALRFSAALAYYSVFSLAPLLIIAVSVAGFLFGKEVAREEILQQVTVSLGSGAAEQIGNLIETCGRAPKSMTAAIFGVVTLMIGACGVFAQLKDALNAIWGVRLRPGTALRDFAREYTIAFGVVLAFGFLLTISVLLTTIAEVLGRYVGDVFPFLRAAAPLNEVISFLVLVVLFGLIYKVLPDVEIGWREVRVGAFVTAIFFTIGKYLIALYLAHSGIASSFGAAGALVLLLVWIYYSSTIFLFGAEFTKVYARECGRGIHPSKHAILVTGKTRTEQALEKPS